MTKNINDGFNHDLGNDFVLASLVENYKRTVKNKYMEVCKMEKEKLKESYAERVVFDVMCIQADLKADCNEESSVVLISYDFGLFGLDYVFQRVFCSSKKSYRRILSVSGDSKFVVEDIQGGRQ